ncbi:hypothetical protein P389DRAFT_86896 [Cystobasidium minutum MCA 4210]|uniref:uncharacterized protein n=1 Tax=Cystobasidium minutum MCA 4210 TaxID=1397322 RepID=UPI0034CD3D93|eukprot:jgi/Rhomi1/86896/CE86895_89
MTVAQFWPLEVVNLIFRYIEEGDDNARDPCPFFLDAPPILVRSTTHQQNLIELLVVCRAWLPAAIRALYRRLQLSSQHSLIRAMETLERYPARCYYVKSLYVNLQPSLRARGSPVWSLTGALLAPLVNLEAYLLDVPRRDPRFKYISLPTEDNGCLQYLGIVSGQPEDQSVDNHFLGVEQLPSSLLRLDLHEVLEIDCTSFNLPRLETLCVGGYDLWRSKKSTFKNCPALRNLVIHKPHEAEGVMALLESCGPQITYMQLAVEGAEGSFINEKFVKALPKLEHLECHKWLPSGPEITYLPPSITHFTGHCCFNSNHEIAEGFLQALLDPSFLPGLAAFPDLIHIEDEETTIEDVALKHQTEAVATALRLRGLHILPSPKNRFTERDSSGKICTCLLLLEGV